MTSKLVLIADGNPDDALRLAHLFEPVGARVMIATDSADALELIRKQRPDLIVSEVELPGDINGTGGFDLRRALAAISSYAKIPFIFVSASPSASTRIEGLRLGAVDFFSKPVDREALVARVRYELESQQPASVPRDKVSGTFGLISCASLLQCIEASRSSGVLYFEGADTKGTLTIVAGAIVGASTGDRSGEDAALDLLSIEAARFSFKPLAGDPPSGEPIIVQELLLDAAWLRDEAVRLAAHLPAENAWIQIADPQAVECFPSREEWRAVVERAGQGAYSIASIAEALDIGRYRCRIMLARGVHSGSIRVVGGPGSNEPVIEEPIVRWPAPPRRDSNHP